MMLRRRSTIATPSARTTALLGAVLIALICLVAPAVSSAAITPTVAVIEPSGNAAGSTQVVDVDILAFNATSGDSVKNVTLELPSGLLINEETNNGACLGTPTPTPACQIGGGTITLSGVSTPAALYLVAPPGPTALAGVTLVAGGLTLSGPVTFHSSSAIGIDPSFNVTEEVTLANMPTAPTVDALNLALTGLSMPSACDPAVLTVHASSHKLPTTDVTNSQPFTVSNCLGLPFQPSVQSATISRDTGLASGNFKVVFANPPGDSSLQGIKFHMPPNLSISPAQDPCFEGLVCNVGTVSAVSPIMPTTQLTGPIVLTGTLHSPSLTLSLSQPASLQLGAILGRTSLRLLALPDIPMTTLTLDFTGDALGGLFAVECYATTYHAVFTTRSGGPSAEVSNPITVGNCKGPKSTSPVGEPTAQASVSGAATGSPSLVVKAVRGHFNSNIKSLTVTLPKGGLSFAAGPVATGAVSLTGATLAAASVAHGVLFVHFKHASGNATLTVHGPLLVESSALHQQAQAHKAQRQQVLLWVTDNVAHRTKLSVALPIS